MLHTKSFAIDSYKVFGCCSPWWQLNVSLDLHTISNAEYKVIVVGEEFRMIEEFRNLTRCMHMYAAETKQC
jgi:hypothetical protein